MSFQPRDTQLVMRAEYDGADIRTRTELRDLPEGHYRNLETVISTVTAYCWIQPSA